VVCLTSIVTATAGLVVDGWRYVAAHSRAANLALSAARFGAQNMTDIRAGNPRVECRAAIRDARAFAAARGQQVWVGCDDHGVTVRVVDDVDMRFLAVVGVESRTLTVERRAEPMWG